jgi:hypothetical protein
MSQYFVIFCVPAAAVEQWVSTVDESERKAQSDKMMKDWQAWQSANQGSIVDNGHPLGKTKRVTAGSITDVKNDLNYGMIIQAESHDAAANLIKTNPHLQIPNAYTDVMEIPHMGM